MILFTCFLASMQEMSKSLGKVKFGTNIEKIFDFDLTLYEDEEDPKFSLVMVPASLFLMNNFEGVEYSPAELSDGRREKLGQQ